MFACERKHLGPPGMWASQLFVVTLSDALIIDHSGYSGYASHLVVPSSVGWRLNVCDGAIVSSLYCVGMPSLWTMFTIELFLV